MTIDSELREAQRDGDIPRVRALMDRWLPVQKKVVTFNHVVLGERKFRITYLPEAGIQVIDTVEVIRDVPLIRADVSWRNGYLMRRHHARMAYRLEGASHPSDGMAIVERGTTKGTMLYFANDVWLKAGSFNIVAFKVVEVNKPRNRKERRAMARFRGLYAPTVYVDELSPTTVFG